MKKRKLPLVMFLAGTLMLSTTALTSCSSTQTSAGKPLPELTFEQMNQIPVNVSRIEFVNDTQRGAHVYDDVANSLPTPPDIAMRRYLNQRFKANAADGVLKITLTKAEVKEGEVPNDVKLLSFIDLANNENYRFEVIVDLERMYLAGQPNLKSSVRFTRDAKMPMNVSLAYREAKLQRTLEEMMRDIDEALITSIGYKFGLIDANNIPRRALPVNTELPENETRVGAFANETFNRMNSGNNNTAGETRMPYETSEPTPLVVPNDDVTVERLD